MVEAILWIVTLGTFVALLSFAASVRTAPVPSPIVGGELVEPGGWPAVVGVLVGSEICSGTLVAPDLVLTAAHCLPEPEPTVRITVRLGDGLYVPSAVGVDAERAEQHPDFCGKTKCGDDSYDFAYVRLAEPVNGVEFPLPIVDQDEWDEHMTVGEPVTLVGFGTDDPGGAQPSDPSFPKREAETELRKLTDGGLMFLAGGDPADSCSGDSGGPAFLRVGDQVRLAGVLSQGSNPCGSGGYYGVPWAALPWLAEATGWTPAGYDPETSELDTGVAESCAVIPGDGGGLVLVAFAWLRRRRPAAQGAARTG